MIHKRNKKNNKQSLYDKEYFEQGTKREAGEYSLKALYPYFDELALHLRNVFNPSRVLDIGCAKGFLVLCLNNLGIDAEGVDISSYAISNSPKKIRKRLHQLDVETDIFPFPDEYFDLVTMIAIIEHLSSFDHCLKEVYRILKRDGYIFMITSLPEIDPHARDRDITHINVHSHPFWINLFSKYGFTEDYVKMKLIRREVTKTSSKIRYAYKRKTLSKDLSPSTKIGHMLFRMGKNVRSWAIFLISILRYSKSFDSRAYFIFKKSS
jgi:ubiquinone/menaquinone biosynthesis C-methylase UbiE